MNTPYGTDTYSEDNQEPKTSRVLDMRTCLVIRDGDGDPIGVLDPSVGENEALKQRITDKGWTLNERKKS